MSTSTAELSSITGEKLKIDYATSYDEKFLFFFSDDVSIVQYLKDPDLSLNIPETVFHDIRLGFRNDESLLSDFLYSFHLGFKQFAFFSPDNFVDYGIYRLFVPSIGLSGFYRLLYLGRRTRVGVRGGVDLMGAAEGGGVYLSSGYQGRGSVVIEVVVGSALVEFESEIHKVSQRTSLANYDRLQNHFSFLFRLFF